MPRYKEAPSISYCLMGRPRSDISKLRSVIFMMRLTPDEQKKLLMIADTCGRKPADVVRDKLFKGTFPEPKIAKIDQDAYFELKKISVNLNQLTRLANAGKINMGLLTILLQLMRQQEKIINRILYRDSHPKNR